MLPTPLCIEPLHRLLVRPWQDMSLQRLLSSKSVVEHIRDFADSRVQVCCRSLD